MNVLLVGAGWIAEMVYVPFLNYINTVDYIYILDIDVKSIQKKFTHYEKVKIVSKNDIEKINYKVVCILSPNFMHYAHIMNFIKKDVIILVEKPLCIEIQELENIKEACRNKQTSIYVSTPFRYRADIQSIRNIILSGVLGNIYRVEISWLKRRGTPGASWFTQKSKAGGGVLMDMGPHMLDLFYWLLGERVAKSYLGAMSSVFLENGDAYAVWHKSIEKSLTPDVEDSSFSHLIYEDMSLALNLVWASNIENDYAQIKLYGSKAVLDVLTSIGFSTNTLYKETTISLIKEGHSVVEVLPIEDRKEPFSKLLGSLFSGAKTNLADVTSALHVMQDIFNIYNHSFSIKR